ncbi:hypothetical protein NE237_025837 [Protea cynaroides]|uniref:Uncharacterized protein n=1 Tax=Protea cynaroides TaxID=273540 RepID=A0A9Q0K0K5_9MAGN|nr:hypothetical protein NE237_025837 [Protea cynaroides]
MLGFGAAPAPTSLRFKLTTPYWLLHRHNSRSLCSCNIRIRRSNSNTSTFVSYVNSHNDGHANTNTNTNTKRMKMLTAITTSCRSLAITLLTAALLVVFSTAPAVTATEPPAVPDSEETLSNIPQMLSGECASPSDCKKARIQHPKSRKAESCTVKCVNTCIRGGTGEGPLNARRPLVVFKAGFRSRQYCLVECSDICNLIKDGEDGP